MVKIDIKVVKGKAYITIEDFMFLCDENNVPIDLVVDRLELIAKVQPKKIVTIWHDYYSVDFFKGLY